MELREINYNKNEYVETVSLISSNFNSDNKALTIPKFQASGNKVCRQTVLCGSQNIILQGKVIVQAEAIIRGDLANVRTGRYCIISKEAVIRPPYKKFSKG